IKQRVQPIAIERFGEGAKIPETPHVEGDVNESAVEKHVGDEPPGLTTEGERAEIRSPLDQELRGGVGDGRTGPDHGKKDDDVDGKEEIVEGAAERLRALPGCRHDALVVFVLGLAALDGFVLHTPLAEFSPDRESDFASAALALCHERRSSIENCLL